MKALNHLPARRWLPLDVITCNYSAGAAVGTMLLLPSASSALQLLLVDFVAAPREKRVVVEGDRCLRQPSPSAAGFSAFVEARVMGAITTAVRKDRNPISLWLVWTFEFLLIHSKFDARFICKRRGKKTWWCIRGLWTDWDGDPRTNQSRPHCCSPSCPAGGAWRQSLSEKWTVDYFTSTPTKKLQSAEMFHFAYTDKTDNLFQLQPASQTPRLVKFST